MIIARQRMLASQKPSTCKTVGNRVQRTWARFTLTTATAVLFLGCTSTTNMGRFIGDKHALRKSHNQTRATQNYIKKQAFWHQLPEKYISEARIGMAEVETKLDSARAAEVERDATFQERTARVSAKRRDSESREQIALAEIDQLNKEREARQDQLAARLAAREREIQADAIRRAKLREATAKEGTTAQTVMISQAEQDYTEANARTEQLRAIRTATEEEGLAAIDEMRESVQATRARAAATVAALRTEAASNTEQTKAELFSLAKDIETFGTQAQTESARLAARASALEQEQNAMALELKARADALEQQIAIERYGLKMTVATTDRQQSQTKFERLSAKFKARNEQSFSEINRQRGDANQTIENAETHAAKQIEELRAWLKDSLSDVHEIRSQADRLEKVARAEFVKAETQALANATRETVVHQYVLSEEKMDTIIAAAEVEAARIREQIRVEIARKLNARSVAFEGKTDTAKKQSTELHQVPNVATVDQVTPLIHPGHIAAYRTTLARVMHETNKADALQSVVEATFEERRSKIEAANAQQVAIGTEKLATADAMMMRAEAELSKANAQIEADLAVAHAAYDRAVVEASAMRKDALAEAADLRAIAKAAKQNGLAQATALRKEADVVAKNGQSEVRALQAELRATEQRGHAETGRLMAEAVAIEQSEAALSERIVAQIASAGRILAAELTKLARSIESEVAIADANYEETLVQAEVIGRKAEMQVVRLQAQDELETTIAKARSERIRDQLYVENIKDQAEIQRRLANAQATRDQADALADAEQTAIRTDAQITTAGVIADRRVALANEHAIKALFNARLVQVNAGRVKQKTGVFLDGSIHRRAVQTAVAQAKAARADTKQKLVRLAKHQKSLQQAAVRDWDARLVKTP